MYNALFSPLQIGRHTVRNRFCFPSVGLPFDADPQTGGPLANRLQQYEAVAAGGADHEKLIRALALSNLVAMYQKNQLGKLSAYCGVVSASIGSGAAIAWLSGGDEACVERTITNAIADVSGIVCDGAKSSCAAKIASSVFSAIMGYYMAVDGNVFQPGEGLVGETLAETVNSYTRMGRVGMASTDIAILNMMIGK